MNLFPSSIFSAMLLLFHATSLAHPTRHMTLEEAVLAYLKTLATDIVCLMGWDSHER